MIITREQAIDYLNKLGDSIDWEDWSLEQIRVEVLAGDDYDGENIWQSLLDYYDADDIAA